MKVRPNGVRKFKDAVVHESESALTSCDNCSAQIHGGLLCSCLLITYPGQCAD